MYDIKKILVVFADAGRARFFIAHGAENILEIEDLTHAEGHMMEHDLTTKEHDSNTYPYADDHRKKEHARNDFAKIVVNKIEHILKAQSLDEVCIFAPAKFIGDINKSKLSKHVKVTEVIKDLTHFDLSHLKKAIINSGLSFLV